jgi:hypothetical protein
VSNGDQLIWLDGSWVAIPGQAVDAVTNATTDTVFGYLTPANSPVQLNNSKTQLNTNRVYLNPASGHVYVYDSDYHVWTLMNTPSASEFIDIDTGDIYQLSEEPVRSTPQGGRALSMNSKPSLAPQSTNHALTGPFSSPSRQVALSVGNGQSTTFTVTHSLNTMDVWVEVYDARTGVTANGLSVSRKDANTVVVIFPSAPGVDQYRIIIRA